MKNQTIKISLFFLLIFTLNLVLRLPLIISAVLSCLYCYFRMRKSQLKGYKPLYLGLLFLIGVASSFFIIKSGLGLSYLPFSLIPMLATLLFNQLEISLLLSITTAVSVASISDDPFSVALFYLLIGISASMINLGVRKRAKVIQAGLIIGLLQVLLQVIIKRSWLTLPAGHLNLLLNGIISSIIVLGILPVFEYLFKTITNISLLELIDSHHPILKRLVFEAPGTHLHSLVVGNLSESACDKVGANALLARVGAYYHDIGKLSKPWYFSENHSITDSKHDKLSPTMSKMIIMNHVKEGVELAKKHHLGQRIIDFIQQHHGNSLVYYFYRRALESTEEDQEVKEEGFRYPGPKPNSKETAIVLLADSVEAATRALKDPTPVKVEELVRKVVNNKFIDGQLDDCDLTLKDLEKISAIFIRILGGIYHTRVSYPEEDKPPRPS